MINIDSIIIEYWEFEITCLPQLWNWEQCNILVCRLQIPAHSMQNRHSASLNKTVAQMTAVSGLQCFLSGGRNFEISVC